MFSVKLIDSIGGCDLQPCFILFIHFSSHSFPKVIEAMCLADDRVQSALLPGLVLILIAVTGWMKLISYAHVNKDMRELLRAKEKVASYFFVTSEFATCLHSIIDYELFYFQVCSLEFLSFVMNFFLIELTRLL